MTARRNLVTVWGMTNSTQTLMTVTEAVAAIKSAGHSVSTDWGTDSTLSVYVNGEHAFDHEQGQRLISSSVVRSVLNDHA